MNSNEAKKIKTSNTQARAVKTYPSPLYHRLIEGYAAYTGQSESSAVSDMVKKFFDSVHPEEKKRYLQHSKNSY